MISAVRSPLAFLFNIRCAIHRAVDIDLAKLKSVRSLSARCMCRLAGSVLNHYNHYNRNDQGRLRSYLIVRSTT